MIKISDIRYASVVVGMLESAVNANLKYGHTAKNVVSRLHGVTTGLDISVQEGMIKSLKRKKFPADVLSEELESSVYTGDGKRPEQPPYLVTMDPLDGTANANRERPSYSATVAVLKWDCDRDKDYSFKDVVAAGTVDLVTGDMWYADDRKCLKKVGGKWDASSTSKIVDLNSDAHFIIDLHYPDNRKLFDRLPNVKFRDYGSTAVHFAMIADGRLDGFVSLHQKSHELGPGYLLITKAGGIVTGGDGRLLDYKTYDFSASVPVVASANPTLHNKILAALNKYPSCF